jgi:hypothetical protein
MKPPGTERLGAQMEGHVLCRADHEHIFTRQAGFHMWGTTSLNGTSRLVS